MRTVHVHPHKLFSRGHRYLQAYRRRYHHHHQDPHLRSQLHTLVKQFHHLRDYRIRHHLLGHHLRNVVCPKLFEILHHLAHHHLAHLHHLGNLLPLVHLHHLAHLHHLGYLLPLVHLHHLAHHHFLRRLRGVTDVLFLALFFLYFFFLSVCV
ncbi:hypothetical protein Q4I28_001219 [Leishmania naiffi]|uniref:Uncharacterized protein n=1 Tax=Leishmania naiffi TaxID=5678 RepID=A0AAW3C864_9TRYP